MWATRTMARSTRIVAGIEPTPCFQPFHLSLMRSQACPIAYLASVAFAHTEQDTVRSLAFEPHLLLTYWINRWPPSGDGMSVFAVSETPAPRACFCLRRSLARVYVASASLSGELGFLRVLVYDACDVHLVP